MPLDDSYSFDAGIGEKKNKAQSKHEKERALIEALIIEHSLRSQENQDA